MDDIEAMILEHESVEERRWCNLRQRVPSTKRG